MEGTGSMKIPFARIAVTILSLVIVGAFGYGTYDFLVGWGTPVWQIVIAIAFELLVYVVFLKAVWGEG